MPNISHKTKPIATRISVEAYAILDYRARRKKLKVSEYVRRKIEYDVKRKH